MTNKEKFITELEAYISHETTIPFSDEAWSYFQSLKATPEKEKPLFTEMGAKALDYMQKNYTARNNIFKAKDIAEGLFLSSSRSVAGSMRKLASDGYVTKIDGTPSHYSLTDLGKVCEIIFPEPKEAVRDND